MINFVAKLFFFFAIMQSILCQTVSMERILQDIAIELNKNRKITSLKEFQMIKDREQAGIIQLISIAKKKDAPVSSRNTALMVLEHLGNSDTMESFLPIIKDRKEDYSIRQQIVQTAVVLNSPGISPLLLSIIQGKESIDIPVGYIIARLNISERSPFLAKLSTDILNLFQDKDPRVRQKAASIFVVWQNSKASSGLIELTKDGSPEVRSTAIWSLGSQRKEDHTQEIKKALGDPSSLVRERCFCVLAYPNYLPKVMFQEILNLYKRELTHLRTLTERYKILSQAEENAGHNAKALNQEKQFQRLVLQTREAKRILGEQKILFITLLSLLGHFCDRKESLDILFSWLLEENADFSLHVWNVLSSQSENLLKNKVSRRKIFLNTLIFFKKVKNPAVQNSLVSFLEKISGKKAGQSFHEWNSWWEKEGSLLFP